ncbi:MAG: hypothetical protein ACRED7_04675, partial [Stellaceae bacterium]
MRIFAAPRVFTRWTARRAWRESGGGISSALDCRPALRYRPENVEGDHSKAFVIESRRQHRVLAAISFERKNTMAKTYGSATDAGAAGNAFAKMMGEWPLSAFNYEAMMDSQRRNWAALIEANKLWSE